MNSVNLSPDTHTAADVVRLLELQPLDREGGFFRRTAEGPAGALAGRRSWSAILFLLTPDGFSALHRLASDEIWTFITGDPVESLRLRDGIGEWVKLGLAPAAGTRVQDVVRAGTWQGTRLVPEGRWALVSCVVVPGFVWQDFELGDRSALTASYPGFAREIAELTRPEPASGSQ
jgi:predicted cupin superfamily sugar epimerase